ncbi:hypothetical protein BH10ACI4_BH10ACI4_03710 [soil metagenome]
MLSRKTWFVAMVILINAAICLFWAALILDDPRRSGALIVLLLLQVATNLLVIGITKKLRLSGLTIVFVLGLAFGIFNTFRTGEWWTLIFIPFSLALIIGSVKIHRLLAKDYE